MSDKPEIFQDAYGNVGKTQNECGACGGKGIELEETCITCGGKGFVCDHEKTSCQDCGEENISPNFEAFELSGKIVCDECANEIFEANSQFGVGA